MIFKEFPFSSTLRFFGVGGLGAVGYVLAATTLQRVEFSVEASSVIAYLAMIPLVYIAQKRFTFRSDAPHRRTLPRYIAVQITGVSVSALIPWISVKAGVDSTFSYIVVCCLVALLNFAALKFWTFGNSAEINLSKPNAQYNVAAPDSLSVRVAAHQRKKMFDIFLDTCGLPDQRKMVLDIGVTSDRSYAASNYLELWYPYKDKITASGIDDASFLETEYPGMRYVKADALNLPFNNCEFDVVHSSAVLEHVGSDDNQIQMIKECARVTHQYFFITTPNRWFPIEFHTVLPLVHWLPKAQFRSLMRAFGRNFFAEEANLNLTDKFALKKMLVEADLQEFDVSIRSASLLGWPSNILLIGRRRNQAAKSN